MPSTELMVGDKRIDLRIGLVDGVRIEPKLMRLLEALIQGAPYPVSVNELVGQVWETVVSDSAVHQAIAKLRKVLVDEPSSPKYIEDGAPSWVPIDRADNSN